MKENPNKAVIRSLRNAEEKRVRAAACCVGAYACKSAAKDCDVFGVPFFAMSHDLALKAVSQVCPSGLNLYHLGYFHADTGKLEALSRPVLVKGKINEK